MNEQLISFKTDKLAKEKGIILERCKCGGFPDCICSGKRPTQSLLQKFLREKHNIYIGVHPLEISACDKSGYRFTWYSCELNGDKELCDSSPLGHLTYEEALEEGLKEALKLIKNES